MIASATVIRRRLKEILKEWHFLNVLDA